MFQTQDFIGEEYRYWSSVALQGGLGSLQQILELCLALNGRRRLDVVFGGFQVMPLCE
jgi:hypothetical protein